jgi:eukaryotic-like serine/threonine-protein kinase
MLRLPTVFVDRYRLERLLGEGSFSHTYLAIDMRLDRRVAVKVLRREYARDPGLADRFKREARIAASISSEHVVEVYDYDQHEDSLFIVSEWVDGIDLARVLELRPQLPVGEACRITRDILAGLAAVHDAGILHRDIKPQNVLIPRHDRPAKLADFGIARGSDDPRLTRAGEAIGTPAYMSPEQAGGKPLSPATDLYSVAVILFHLVTGELPFTGESSTQVMVKHITEEPPRPSALNPDVSHVVEAVILRGMAKEPSRRFASAQEMSLAIDDALAGRDVRAATRSAPEEARPVPPPPPDPTPTTARPARRQSRPRRARRRRTLQQRMPPYSVSLLLVTAGVILLLAIILASC